MWWKDVRITGWILGSVWVTFFITWSVFQAVGLPDETAARHPYSQYEAPSNQDVARYESQSTRALAGYGSGDGRQDSSASNQEKNSNRELPFWWRALVDFVQVVVGVIALVFVFWQVTAARAQVKQSIAQVAQAEAQAVQARAAVESMRGADRPWLVMDKPTLPAKTLDEFRNLNTLAMTFDWRNAGRSPAFVLEQGARLFSVAKPYSFDDSVWDMIGAPSIGTPIIAPDSPSGDAAFYTNFSSSLREDLDLIASAQRLLIFQAFIRYKDVFGEEHYTRYCVWRFVHFGLVASYPVSASDHNKHT